MDHGLNYPAGLKLGYDELNWLQYENNERGRHARLAGMRQPGLLVGVTLGTTLDGRWLPTINANRLVIDASDRPSFVDADGYLVTLTEDAEITIPDDATWYTLVARRSTSAYERGRIALTTGSKTVTGTGTEFTRFRGYTTHAAGSLRRGTMIRIDEDDSSQGNGGLYEVDEITDDTTLILRTAPAGSTETGLRFSVAGQFAGVTPSGSDLDIHQRIVPEFKLVARTASPAAGDLVICDVKRDSNASPEVITLDRRHANLWHPLQQRRGHSRLAPDLRVLPGPTFYCTMRRSAAYTPVSGYACGCAGAPAVLTSTETTDSTPQLVLIVETSEADIATRIQLADGSWTDGGQVIADGTPGEGDAPAIAALPVASGYTHLAAWVNSSRIAIVGKRSPDNGATWAGAETVIWDASSAESHADLTNPQLLLTRRGRLLLIAGHRDSSNQYSIRYVYSDDYGQTWETNNHAGYPIVDLPSDGTPWREASSPCCVQAPDGRIWTLFMQHGVDGGNPITCAAFVVSVDEDSPTPADPAAPGQQLFDPDNDHRVLAAWAAPDGSIVVLVEGDDPSPNLKHIVIFGRPGQDGSAIATYTRIETFLEITHAGVGAPSLMLPELVEAHGRLSLFYADVEDATNAAIQQIGLHAVHCPLSPRHG